jgi:protein-disulfide isomerase
MTRSARLVAVAAIALLMAACGSEETEGGLPAAEPIAAIAPPAGQSWVETAAATPEGGFRIGNPEAPLKLVEYASHTCHVCAEFAQTGAAPLDEYVATGVVSYEIRNLIRDPVDLTIALLARCGTPQVFHPLANQAWQNFDGMMAQAQADPAAMQQAMAAPEGQRFQGIAQAAGLLDFFAARGISRDQAMQCLADTEKARAIVEKSQADSDELRLTGTPTFFLNGSQIEGTSWTVVEPVLQRAGAR